MAAPASTGIDSEAGQASSASSGLALLVEVANNPASLPSGLEAPPPPPPQVTPPASPPPQPQPAVPPPPPPQPTVPPPPPPPKPVYSDRGQRALKRARLGSTGVEEARPFSDFTMGAGKGDTWSSEVKPLGVEEVDLLHIEGRAEVALLGLDSEPPRALSMLELAVCQGEEVISKPLDGLVLLGEQVLPLIPFLAEKVRHPPIPIGEQNVLLLHELRTRQRSGSRGHILPENCG